MARGSQLGRSPLSVTLNKKQTRQNKFLACCKKSNDVIAKGGALCQTIRFDDYMMSPGFKPFTVL